MMRLLEIEDHVLGEGAGAIVVMRQVRRLLARQLRAVLLELIAHHGLHRELQAPEIGAAAAIDLLIGRTPTAALAVSELADDLFLAIVDVLLAQIDLRFETRRRGRSSSELASGDEQGADKGADGGAKCSHNPCCHDSWDEVNPARSRFTQPVENDQTANVR